MQSTPTMLWLRRGSSLQSMASWMQGLSQKFGSENGGGSSQELAMTAMLQTPSPAVFDSSAASSHCATPHQHNDQHTMFEQA